MLLHTFAAASTETGSGESGEEYSQADDEDDGPLPLSEKARGKQPEHTQSSHHSHNSGTSPLTPPPLIIARGTQSPPPPSYPQAALTHEKGQQ